MHKHILAAGTNVCVNRKVIVVTIIQYWPLEA